MSTKFLHNMHRLLIKIDTSWTTLCSSFHPETLPQYGNGETRPSSSGDLLNSGQQCPSLFISWPLVLGCMITVRIESDPDYKSLSSTSGLMIIRLTFV